MITITVNKNEGRPKLQNFDSKILTSKIEGLINPFYNVFLDTKLNSFHKLSVFKNLKNEEQVREVLSTLLGFAEVMENYQYAIRNFYDSYDIRYEILNRVNPYFLHSNNEFILLRLKNYDKSLLDLIIENISSLNAASMKNIKEVVLDNLTKLLKIPTMSIEHNKKAPTV